MPAMNGLAMGGGLELALPEVKLGIIPGTGGTRRLPRLIGKGKAYELLLTGDAITAEEALKIGLVNKVVSRGEALKAAEEMAGKIMANAPIAVEMCKDAVEIGMGLPLEQAVQYSQKNCITCFSTEDMKEGIGAFLEKRKPNFKGK